MNGNNGKQLRTPILTLGKTVKVQAIRRLGNRLLMIIQIKSNQITHLFVSVASIARFHSAYR